MKIQILQKRFLFLTLLFVSLVNIQPAKANIFTEKVIIQTTVDTPDLQNNQNNRNIYLLAMLAIGGIGFALGLRYPFFLINRISKTKDKELIKLNQSETIAETKIEISSHQKETSKYSLYIEKAYKNFGKGDIEGALKNFNEAICSQPHNAKIYSERANFRKNKLGDKEGAIADYTQAINMNPDNALFYFCRSQTYLELGDRRKAIEDYNTAMDIVPEDIMDNSVSKDKS